METFHPLFYINLFSYKFGVTSPILIEWIIILLMLVLSIVSTRKLQKIPNKKQTIIEMIYGGIYKLVEDNMGKDCKGFVPYIGTLMIYLLIMNLLGLIGLKPPTLDFNVALGLSIISFIVIQGYAIKKSGLWGYTKGYGEPFLFLAPLNIIERVMLPVSLALRLLGNMTAALLIIDLIYSVLGKLSWFAQLVVPIPLHIYFDLFDGTIQTIIFVMLTMINIKVISEH